MNLFPVRVTILDSYRFAWNYDNRSNTAVSQQREKYVLQTRLGEDILDRINIDGPSLGNFDTENLFSHWSESAVTLRHLNGHNSFRTETHEEANENVIVL